MKIAQMRFLRWTFFNEDIHNKKNPFRTWWQWLTSQSCFQNINISHFTKHWWGALLSNQQGRQDELLFRMRHFIVW